MSRQITPTPLTDDDHKARELFVEQRKELGLDPRQLANELGMSPRAIHFYEKGERVIPQHARKAMDMLVALKGQKEVAL